MVSPFVLSGSDINVMSILSVFCFLFAAGTSDLTFWREMEMMLLDNGAEPYLQEALEYATFMKLDSNHDGIISHDELAVLNRDVQREVMSLIPADLTKEALQASMRFPTFEIKEGMPEYVKDDICELSYAFSEIDYDVLVNQMVTANIVNDMGSDMFDVMTSSNDMVPDLHFEDWKHLAERDWMPNTYSNQLVIPEACKSRRRRLFRGVLQNRHVLLVFGAAIVGALETLLIECTSFRSGSWWNPASDTCTFEHAAKVTAVGIIVGEGAIAWQALMAQGRAAEAAEEARDTSRAVAEILGRPVRDTEQFIPYFATCNYWGCSDEGTPISSTTTTTLPLPLPTLLKPTFITESVGIQNVQLPRDIPSPSLPRFRNPFGRRKQ